MLMSKRRIGNRVALVNWVLTSVSLGIRMKRLSKVRSLTDMRSMECTRPSVSPIWMASPTWNGFSQIRKMPLIRLERLVCEANPIATPAMPAARPG